MTHAERIYYDRRAAEYDDWYLGAGLYASRARPGWHAELDALRALLRAFSLQPVLDVACGTGFLTQRLPGHPCVQGDALQLPFRTDAFPCVMAAHFYGHLDATPLLIVDASLRDDVQAEEWQQRELRDGSRHAVYKRYFTPAQLAAELSGGQMLHAGRWFLATLVEIRRELVDRLPASR